MSKSNAQLVAEITMLQASLAQAADDLIAAKQQYEELQIALGVAEAECRRKESIIQMLRKRPTQAEFREATGRDYVAPNRRPQLSGLAQHAAAYCRAHNVRSVDPDTLRAWVATQQAAA